MNMRDQSVTEIRVARDFSETPGPRYIKQGPFSGESFRRSKLLPALREYRKIVVVFDGTVGFGSSFIDEAFGGLVRSEGFDPKEVEKRFEFVSREDPLLITDALESIREARPVS